MNKKVSLPLHVFIAFVYVPLSIAYFLYDIIKYQKYRSVLYFNFDMFLNGSIMKYLMNALYLALPLLLFIAFIGLLKRRSFGRKTILFSTSFLFIYNLSSLFSSFIFRLSYKIINVESILLLLLYAILPLLIFIYYEKRSQYFPNKDGYTEKEGERKGKSIASFVFGTLSFSLITIVTMMEKPYFYIGVGVVVLLGIIGLILSSVAKKKGEKSAYRTAGFVLSLLSPVYVAATVTITLFIVFLVLAVICGGLNAIFKGGSGATRYVNQYGEECDSDGNPL